MPDPKAVLYLTAEPGSVGSLLEHLDKIDILVPSVYTADEQGVVRGAVDARVLEAARQARLPVMPIVLNPGFQQETVHRMLVDPAARQRLAKMLLEECGRHGYRGFQLDFENIPAPDRPALSALIRETSALLGREGFRLSIAVMYQSEAYPGRGPYTRWLWENWLGAYDLAEIAGHVEFVSVMTYDQHTERTAPGPIAGFYWVEEILHYCLRMIPKEKLSLGIPLYGRRWYAGSLGKEPSVLTATLSAPEAARLAEQRKVEPQWEASDRAPWYWFTRDEVREYVFYNDARSFRERYDLARRHGLHGFSAWVLGAEDPQIWKELPVARRDG